MKAFFGCIISIQEVAFLLGYWRPHSEFQEWLEQKLLSLLPALEPQIHL